ncbi:MAG: Trm112 family protein [Candidatus Aegiribacteria sp.]|nr:Trm112 family protein [Candidatus Aegiribacteria sp.]
MLDERLLSILACPKCKGELEYRTDPEEVLVCNSCALVYEVKDDIPIMLIEEAKPLNK